MQYQVHPGTRYLVPPGTWDLTVIPYHFSWYKYVYVYVYVYLVRTCVPTSTHVGYPNTCYYMLHATCYMLPTVVLLL